MKGGAEISETNQRGSIQEGPRWTLDWQQQIMSVPAATKSVEKERYLLVDHRFARLVLVNLVGMMCLGTAITRVSLLREKAIGAYFQVNDWMLSRAHQYAWWSLLGLLSSSCCALQLILNAMSMGCAGFNAILGPLRPTLIASTILVQASSWYIAWSRPWQWAPTMASTLIVMSMTFLPELLHAYTALTSNHRVREEESSSSLRNCIYHFKMTSVGCSACMVSVSSTLNKLAGVLDFEASIEKGQLTVVCANGTPPSDILMELENVGFPMEPIENESTRYTTGSLNKN